MPKHSLRILTGLLPGLLFVITTAVQAQTTLKIATIAPDGTSWMNAMRAGAEEIAARTDGRLKLRFYPGGIMGSDQAVLKKIRIGQLHGGALTAGSVAEIYQDAQIYSLPLLFRDYDEVDFVRARTDPALVRGLEDKGFKVLALSEGGFAYLMSDIPIRRVEDLEGQKPWLPQGDLITDAIYDTVGISPVTLPISDVYTGLQTGLIDTIGTTPTAAIAFQWHTRMKSLTDFPLIYVMGMLLVDQRAYQRIATADRVILDEVIGRIVAELDRQNRTDNRKALEILAGQGIEFVRPSAEELTRWHEIADISIEKLGKQGVYSQDMLMTIRERIATYRARAMRE